jgi:hypothetical protein
VPHLEGSVPVLDPRPVIERKKAHKKYTTFRKLDLFSSSGVGKRGIYLVGYV